MVRNKAKIGSEIVDHRPVGVPKWLNSRCEFATRVRYKGKRALHSTTREELRVDGDDGCSCRSGAALKNRPC